MEHLLPFKNWTYPVGPVIAVGLNTVLVLVQGWSCFSPNFKPVDFVSYYVEIAVMIVMICVWKLVKRTRFVRLGDMDLVTDRFDLQEPHEGTDSADDAAAHGQPEQSQSRMGRIFNTHPDEKSVFGRMKRIGMWFFF